MRRSILAIAFAIVLAACGGAADGNESVGTDASALKGTSSQSTARKKGPKAPAPVPAPVPPSVTATVWFSDIDPSGPFTPETQFPVATTSQIYIAADWKNVTGAHTQRLDLFDPNGLLYSSATTAFATTTAAMGSQLQALPQASGSYRVWNTFFVAGTPVEMYHLVGAWKVSVSLDGGAAVATSTFNLY